MADFKGDPYAILGVSPDATLEAIKKEYRKRALSTHPDKFAAQGPAVVAQKEHEFKILNEASNLLLDPERRRKYDERNKPRRKSAAESSRFFNVDVRTREQRPAPRSAPPPGAPHPSHSYPQTSSRSRDYGARGPSPQEYSYPQPQTHTREHEEHRQRKEEERRRRRAEEERQREKQAAEKAAAEARAAEAKKVAKERKAAAEREQRRANAAEVKEQRRIADKRADKERRAEASEKHARTSRATYTDDDPRRSPRRQVVESQNITLERVKAAEYYMANQKQPAKSPKKSSAPPPPASPRHLHRASTYDSAPREHPPHPPRSYTYAAPSYDDAPHTPRGRHRSGHAQQEVPLEEIPRSHRARKSYSPEPIYFTRSQSMRAQSAVRTPKTSMPTSRHNTAEFYVSPSYYQSPSYNMYPSAPMSDFGGPPLRVRQARTYRPEDVQYQSHVPPTPM